MPTSPLLGPSLDRDLSPPRAQVEMHGAPKLAIQPTVRAADSLASAATAPIPPGNAGAEVAPAPAPAPAPASPRVRRLRTIVVVRPVFYFLCWWVVLLLHVMAAVFVFFAACIHLLLSEPTIHYNVSAIQISVNLLRLSGSSYLLITFMHLAAVGKMVFDSVRCGRLILRDSTHPAKNNHRGSAVTGTASAPVVGSSSSSTSVGQPSGNTARGSPAVRVFRWMKSWWARVLGSDGYFGINGPLFHVSLLLRESIEIIMQTYQLFMLSHSVSRSWINQFAVATVVLNCASIPIVNRVFHAREGHRRLMSLVVDMYLDFAVAVVVPVCVMLPYLLAFDWEIGGFPTRLVVDDVWFYTGVGEARQVLVTSYTDFLASLLPQYGIFSCLRLVKSLVRRAPIKKKGVSAHAIHPNEPVAASPSPATVAIAPVPGSSPCPATAAAAAAAAKAGEGFVEKEHRLVRLFTGLVAIWGAFVAAMHIHSAHFSRQVNVLGCHLHLNPWLAKNLSCSVMEVNCYRQGVAGASEDMGRILADFERSVLRKVTFTHCPALVMPSILTEFGSLGGIEVFNSTVAAWPVDAAVRAHTHKMILNVNFGVTNFTEFPAGILHTELPEPLRTIGIYGGNLTYLPENLGELWAESVRGRFGLEHTLVRTLPASFGRIPMRYLWLINNKIEHIPDELFADAAFLKIRFSGNPLQRLPEHMGDTSKLEELFVEHTNVSVLPAWATTWLDAKEAAAKPVDATFFGSAYCTASSRDDAWTLCDRDWGTARGSAPPELVNWRFPL